MTRKLNAKKIIAITLSVTAAFVIIFFVLFCCSVKYFGYGKVYTLRQAYDEGIISRDDLMNIAYYQNGGIKYNEDIMGEDFSPAAAKSKNFGLFEKHAIKATLSDSLSTYGKITVSYKGTYSGATAFDWSEKGDIAPSIAPTVVIDGIKIIFGNNPTRIYCGK